MNIKDWLIPGITIVFAAGISVASLESAAQDTENLSKRVVVNLSQVSKRLSISRLKA